MLSRLISLLSRIPAVKWAFNRLRPLPHGGSIDVTQIAADEQPTIVAIADVAPTVDAISAEPVQRDADVEAAPPVEDNSIASIIEETPSAATTDIRVNDDSSPETPAEVEPVVVETSVDSEPAPSVAAEIEPDLVDDLPPVAANVVEEMTTHVPVAAAQVEPVPAAPAPKSPVAPKARAKVVEPADRTALIRQRWAETGIRMWNPRLHGTGEATLNIQGRIGLLPPEAGETMPRYDKLEFKLLGGQIVCEGVIVEAPVHASQRSFTRLAEPRSADRTREPVRERQAALA